MRIVIRHFARLMLSAGFGPRDDMPSMKVVNRATGREIGVENGVLTAPTDLSDDEQRQIARAGCSPV